MSRVKYDSYDLINREQSGMKNINHCPVCGAEQAQPTPYCRKCGADIRAIQMALDKPDIVSGAAGRDEILRAIADKIRRLPADKDLGEAVKEILPMIEDFEMLEQHLVRLGARF